MKLSNAVFSDPSDARLCGMCTDNKLEVVQKISGQSRSTEYLRPTRRLFSDNIDVKIDNQIEKQKQETTIGKVRLSYPNYTILSEKCGF